MKVFLCWSQADSVSHKVACLLREWLQEVFRTGSRAAIDPFVSTVDVQAGEPWFASIARELKKSSFGLVCLTKQNVRSEWMHFEAGAVFKSIGDRSRVCPLLIDLKPSDLRGPLCQLEATELSDREQVSKLFRTLNDRLEKPVGKAVLEESFDASWPRFRPRVRRLISASKGFWEHFLDRMPSHQKKVQVLLSMKEGVEYVDGQGTEEKGHSPLVSFNELSALLTLGESSPHLSDKLDLVSQPQRDDQTIIIVGGPHANEFCRRAMAGLPKTRFRFETRSLDEAGKLEKTISDYQDEWGGWSESPIVSYPSPSQHPGAEVIRKDYGVIIRAANPFDSTGRNRVLILAGNHGVGTESAVRFLADRRSLELLRDIVEGQDFQALFEAWVGGGRRSVRDVLQGLQGKILALSVLTDGDWKPVMEEKLIKLNRRLGPPRTTR